MNRFYMVQVCSRPAVVGDGVVVGSIGLGLVQVC